MTQQQATTIRIMTSDEIQERHVARQNSSVTYNGPARYINPLTDRKTFSPVVDEIVTERADGSSSSAFVCTKCDYNSTNFFVVQAHYACHFPKKEKGSKPAIKAPRISSSLNTQISDLIETEIKNAVAAQIAKATAKLQKERDDAVAAAKKAKAAQRDAERRLDTIRKSLAI